MIEEAVRELLAGRIPPTVPEPASDIAAQVAALRDPAHPKTAVMIAAGNEDAIPADLSGLTVVRRPAGTLLTTSPAKATIFRITDKDDAVALVLDYPETKRSAIASGDPRVVQVRDAAGNVIQEAATSPHMVESTKRSFERYKPTGGQILELSPEEAIQRRYGMRSKP